MNNNKKTITVCSIIALIILAIVVIVTLISDLTGFSIVFGTFFVILTICLAIYLREEPDEFNAFIKTKKRILRTYDSVIVEVEDIPNIAGKNIIKVKSIEDLVDAQLELREPIYYKNDNDSCFFILLHFNEACIYVLRMNDSVVSPTEQSIRYMKEETTDKTKEQENILENLEKTVVYKLDELRSFRISPIRNNEKINVVDDTAIKKGIEEAKEQEITSSALSSEISKTMYLKDLRERMLKYEEEQMGKTKELAKTQEEIKVKEKVAPKEIEAPVEEKEVEVSPIEKLRKMVKEQEQSLTKELRIKEEAEEAEETENVEKVEKALKVEEKEKIKEDVKEETKAELSASKEEVVREEKTINKEDDIKLQIMDDTDAKKEVKVVDIKEEQEENQDDDLMDQIVVLHSLDEEEDEPTSIEDDEVITHVIVEDNLDDEEDEDEVLSKEIERHSTMEIKIVDETSEIATVVSDEEDEEPAEEILEVSKLSEIEKIEEVEDNTDEENEASTEVETAIEDEEETEADSEEIVQNPVATKTTKEINKTRRTTRPTRKVTHSTRRAQKHTNRKR